MGATVEITYHVKRVQLSNALSDESHTCMSWQAEVCLAAKYIGSLHSQQWILATSWSQMKGASSCSLCCDLQTELQLCFATFARGLQHRKQCLTSFKLSSSIANSECRYTLIKNVWDDDVQVQGNAYDFCHL